MPKRAGVNRAAPFTTVVHIPTQAGLKKDSSTNSPKDTIAPPDPSSHSTNKNISRC